MSRCLSCAFRGEHRTGDPRRPGCAYIQITGHSRLKAVYESLGVDHMTKEARAAMEPENCLVYRKGKRRTVPEVGIVLEGSRRLDKLAKEGGTPLPSSGATPSVSSADSSPSGGAKGDTHKTPGEGGKGRGEPVSKKPRACKWDKEAAMELWKQGLNDPEIGARLGVSSSTIQYWRKELHLMPNHGGATKTSQMLQLYNQGMTDREIAKVLGIGPGSVWYWRKINGLPPVAKNVEPPHFGELWKQGLTDLEIAERSGKSRRTVQTWRYKNKLKPNPKNYVPSQELLERRKKLRELYDQGMTDREIADATGMSEKTAAKFRLDNGLPPHPRERKRSFDAKKARQLWAQGMTDGEISRTLGVSKACIWHWRSRAGLSAVDFRNRPKGINWEETGRRMLKEGATDREIAEAVGRSVATVYSWRKRRGLDYPGRQKKA